MHFRKRLNRKAAAATGVAVILTATIATRSGSALSPQDDRGVEPRMTLTEEFADFVRAAVAKNAAATSLRQWESGGFTPKDIVANAQARRGRQPQALAALCEALSGLDDAGVALFQSEITPAEGRSELPCAPELALRLDSYWSARRASLQTESDALHMSHPELSLKDDHPLPSEEVRVDAAAGPILYGLRREGYVRPGEIAITIDDGPHPTLTRKILNTLRAYGVRSNFFSIGRHAQRWPELVRAEISEGHVTGSHTMTHPVLPRLAVKDAQEEITDARQAVAEAAGREIPFFRFPYGSHDGVLDAFVSEQRMASFLWNMDSEDWKRPDPEDLFHHEVDQLDQARGGILLIHDIHEQTAITLPFLLDELRHRGWKTVVFVPAP